MQSIEYKEGVVISATELKQNPGKYLDFVEELNDVVITKNGNKIARLTPYVTDIEQYLTEREKSPSMGHQEILGGLYLRFYEYFKGKKCRVFLTPFDVHFRKKDIKEPDVMQPDILVACDVEGNVNAKGKYMGTPTLVVEILSESTRSKDMIDKLNTYRLSDVKVI